MKTFVYIFDQRSHKVVACVVLDGEHDGETYLAEDYWAVPVLHPGPEREAREVALGLYNTIGRKPNAN